MSLLQQEQQVQGFRAVWRMGKGPAVKKDFDFWSLWVLTHWALTALACAGFGGNTPQEAGFVDDHTLVLSGADLLRLGPGLDGNIDPHPLDGSHFCAHLNPAADPGWGQVPHVHAH